MGRLTFIAADGFYRPGPEFTGGTAMDLLALYAVADPATDPWLEAMAPPAIITSIRDEAIEDVMEIVSFARAYERPQDQDAALYVQLRLARKVMPWRQYFACAAGNVANPFCDYTLLDFVSTLPPAMRNSKALYKRTLKKMFPGLFGIPRARDGAYTLDFGAECLLRRLAIEMSLQQPSALDAIISPDFGDCLLQLANDRARRGTQKDFSSDRRFWRRGLRWLSRQLMRCSSTGKKRGPAPATPGVVLGRFLILRSALQYHLTPSELRDRLSR
jgi:hypothetical protein